MYGFLFECRSFRIPDPSDPGRFGYDFDNGNKFSFLKLREDNSVESYHRDHVE